MSDKIVEEPKTETSPTPSSKPKSTSKFKTWLTNNKGLLFLTIGSTAISAGALFYLYFYVIKVPPLPSQIIGKIGNFVEPSLVSLAPVYPTATVPGVPRTEESPLNGVLFTKEAMSKMLKRRPVAVMTNNHIAGRPQSGLNDADIVYEAVTESGITRYMSIFWSEGPNKVGPIRSSRQYFLEWLSPFDALYIYDGCASTSDPRTNACGNIYSYSIKSVATRGAWRTNDRLAPHNEYSSILNAWEYGKENNWDEFPEKTESWKFKRDAKFDERGTKTKVKVTFRQDMTNGGDYDSEWIYNRNTNMYTHKIGGQTDIDLESKKSITAKTVIVEETTVTDAFDGKGRVITTTIGQGNAKILMDGKIINAKWKKSSRSDRTRYYNSSGEEIEFNRGRVWISVISKEKGKFDIIEQ